MNFATKRGHVVGADPLQGVENPKPYRPAPVNAATDTELLGLLRELDASRLWPCTKLAIKFQLLTGARPGEVRSATWAEIRADRSVWLIAADRVKSDREFRIHLSKPALAIPEQAKALRSDKCDLVFPDANGAAMEKMAVPRALSRIAERTEAQGGKRLRPHDLRRVYDGHDYTGEMAAAWDRAGAHIEALRAGGAMVIPVMLKQRD